MILIKHIEFIEVDRDPMEIIHSTAPYSAVEVISNRGTEVVPVSLIRELVSGRRFRRPADGTDVVIGMSQQAGDILGLQYEAWESMSEALDDSLIRLRVAHRALKSARAATLWARIKWVFTGFKQSHK